MSWVANMLLAVDIDEPIEAVEAFNRWLESEAPWNAPSVPPGATGVGHLRSLTDDTAAWGGSKDPECKVWGGVLNHADLEAVVERFGATEWRHPSAAQLLVQDQEQSYFHLWMIRDGRPQQFAPPPPEGDDWVA